MRTLDIAGSQRAGTSALITACQAVAGGGGPVLVAGADKRRTRAASPLELTAGDGAAALIVDSGDGAARLLGHATETADFVDHYRGPHAEFDYVWEERWIRDEGLLKLVPAAVIRALEAAGVAPDAVDHFCFPSAARRVGAALARTLGLRPDSVRDNLQGRCGETGTAHPLVMLVHALEEAQPGDTILVTGFGQGCDAIVVQASASVVAARPPVGIGGHLARRREETNYQRYLTINDLVTIERGLRAEVDKQTGLTTLYRNREMLLGLVGGRCRACGTPQYPKSQVCANPDCHAVDSQDDHPFSEMTASLNSYTADRLTYSPDPPAYYGMVQFDEGGRVMIDFTDIDPGAELQVGQPMRMRFRIKDYDTRPRVPALFLEGGARGSPGRHVIMASGIKDKVALLGMGCSKFGERWNDNAEALMLEAFSEALADAGIEKNQIEAAWFATAIEEQHVGKSGIPLAVALRLPLIPVTRVENYYCASGSEAFRGAVYAVASGACDIALALGVEEAQGHRVRRAAAAQPRRGQRHVLVEHVGARRIRPARAGLPGQARGLARGPQARHGPYLGKEPRQWRQESEGASQEADR